MEIKEIFENIKSLPDGGNDFDNDCQFAFELLRLIERKTFTFVSGDIDSFWGEVVYKLADIAKIDGDYLFSIWGNNKI